MTLTMPRLRSLLLLIITAIAFTSCQKEINADNSEFTSAPVEKTISATIEGQVYDENGSPMANALVTVGSTSGSTDKYGFFRFEAASVNQNGGLVKVTKAGYFNGSRSLFYNASQTNFVRIQMIPKVLVGTIDAASGGSVTVNNASVALPANGVIKATGNGAYSGTVNVYAAYLYPASQSTLLQMPGNLFGIQTNNTLATLESYGMVAVELESAAGEKLQIAAGAEATLGFPVSAVNAPASIPLWFFDEATGFWKEEGVAIKTGAQYIGKVKHFSFWNCDYPYGVVDFQAKFTDQNNNPIVNKMVRIETTTGNPSAGCGITDSLGMVSGKIPKNQVLLLKVMGSCNAVIYSQNIGPYNATANLGTVVVNVTPAQLLEVSGKVISCNNANVANGYAYLTVNNILYRCHTDSVGNFKIHIINCSNAATASIFGIDLASQQEGAATTIALTGNTVNAGNILACGTTIQNFINYNIDGQSFSLTSPPDSVYSYYRPANGTTSGSTYVTGYKFPFNTQVGIDFIFSGSASVSGTHTLTGFTANSLDSTTTITGTVPVTITEYGTASQFIAGSFNGSVVNITGTHTISCSFRVRRLQ